MERIISSGGVKYNVAIRFDGLDVEQIKSDAMSFYVWKLQRQIREASESQRNRWATDGITMHASEVGKAIVTTEEIVDKMSAKEAEKAIELLKAKLRK